jgi:hypothetical protein
MPLTTTPARGSTTSTQLQLTATLQFPNYTVTLTEINGKATRSRVFPCRIEDDETMQIPDDLHASTVNLLTGLGQRLAQIHQLGFERENVNF